MNTEGSAWGMPEPVWAMLQFEGELIPEDRDGEFRLW